MARAIRHGIRAGTLALLAALAVAPAAAQTTFDRLLPPPSACPGQSDATAPTPVQERAMRCLVNFARHAEGLAPLRGSAELTRSARLKGREMLRCAEFSHTPCGHPFAWAFERAGLRGRSLGENLAWGTEALASPRETMRMWLGSPGHRRNILAPDWTQQAVAVRVGVAFAGHPGVSVWTSQFGA